MCKLNRICAGLCWGGMLALTACNGSKYHEQLLLADEQVTRSVDSCAKLLDEIPVEALGTEDAALHGLVSSWLLYRQYAQEIPEEPLERAWEYYHDSKDQRRRAQVYFLRSVISQDQKRGQPSQWMEDLYAACLAIEQTDDYLLASQIYQNYSSKFSEVQQFDEARIWVDKFVDAAQRSGHRGEYVQALIFKANNCLYAEEARLRELYHTDDGKILAQHTQFDEAFETIYQALALAKEHQMDVALGRIYTQLALYHSRCQHLDSSLHYARLSTTLNEQLYAQGLRKQLPHYVTLADAHRKLGNADSAIYYATRTYQIANMPLRNKRVAAQMLYNIYADLKGDYKTSMEWMRVFNQLGDSINQKTIASNIEAVQDAAVKEQEKSVLRAENKHTQGWLLWVMLISLLAISYVTYRLIGNRRRYYAHLEEQERDFNQKIAEMRAAETARQQTVEPTKGKEPVAHAKLLLTGSTREQMEVEAGSILFMSSESNYVKVLYVDEEGKVKNKMIRQTMGNIEAQLCDYPGIIRCHRAFIVNMQHVSHATSVSTGLQLTMDATTQTVPVSKTYLRVVRESLEVAHAPRELHPLA